MHLSKALSVPGTVRDFPPPSPPTPLPPYVISTFDKIHKLIVHNLNSDESFNFSTSQDLINILTGYFQPKFDFGTSEALLYAISDPKLVPSALFPMSSTQLGVLASVSVTNIHKTIHDLVGTEGARRNACVAYDFTKPHLTVPLANNAQEIPKTSTQEALLRASAFVMAYPSLCEAHFLRECFSCPSTSHLITHSSHPRLPSVPRFSIQTSTAMVASGMSSDERNQRQNSARALMPPPRSSANTSTSTSYPRSRFGSSSNKNLPVQRTEMPMSSNISNIRSGPSSNTSKEEKTAGCKSFAIMLVWAIFIARVLIWRQCAATQSIGATANWNLSILSTSVLMIFSVTSMIGLFVSAALDLLVVMTLKMRDCVKQQQNFHFLRSLSFHFAKMY